MINHPQRCPHLSFPQIFRAVAHLWAEISSPPSNHQIRAHPSHGLGDLGPHNNHPSPSRTQQPSSECIYEWPLRCACHLHLFSTATTTNWIQRCSYSATSLTCQFDATTAARVGTVIAALIDIVSMSFWWRLGSQMRLCPIQFTTHFEVYK